MQSNSSGVYSTKVKSWIGAGTTRRKTISKKFWYALELPTGQFEVVPLTSNFIAAGKSRFVDPIEFHESYEFEPDFFISPSAVQNLGLGSSVAQDEDNVSIAPEPIEEVSTEEIQQMEQEARADFGVGLTYFRTGDMKKAKEIFSAIPDKDLNWQPEHKHMFSEFGTGLRKTQLHDVALKHYFKALELSPKDEHLCHNIARIYYEQNKYDNCKRWLVKSLQINPDLTPSQQFLTFLQKSGKLPKEASA